MSPKPSRYILYSAILLAVVFFHPLAAAAAPCESLASLSRQMRRSPWPRLSPLDNSVRPREPKPEQA
jgi:hypothetical protein